MTTRKKTSFTLSKECREGLEKIASENNRSMSNQLETLVSDYKLKKKKNVITKTQ